MAAARENEFGGSIAVCAIFCIVFSIRSSCSRSGVVSDASEQFDLSIKEPAVCCLASRRCKPSLDGLRIGVNGCILRGVRCGRRRFTSAAAIQDFLAGQAGSEARMITHRGQRAAGRAHRAGNATAGSPRHSADYRTQQKRKCRHLVAGLGASEVRAPQSHHEED